MRVLEVKHRGRRIAVNHSAKRATKNARDRERALDRLRSRLVRSVNPGGVARGDDQPDRHAGGRCDRAPCHTPAGRADLPGHQAGPEGAAYPPMDRALDPGRPETRTCGCRPSRLGTGEQRYGDLGHAPGILRGRGSLEEIQEDAVEWSERARRELGHLPDHPIRELLSDLAEFAVTRIS